jgi:two-component system nitrogen regulation sensor histidine kinase GlnL
MNLWREIFESLPDAVLVLSASRAPLASNAAAENLLEASPLEHPRVEDLFALNEWLARMVGACFQSGQSLDNPEDMLILGRRKVSVRAEVSPMASRRGEIKSVVVLLHDLSYQRRMERAMDSERQVARLSPAGLAHEVKNPLTGIKGAAELLAALFATDAQAQQYCEVISHGVERITSLVEQVLSASKPVRLKREPINIHRILHQALRSAGLFDVTLEGLTVEQLFDPSLPELIGDAEALEGVFLNLLRNAIDAIRQSPQSGQHTLRVRTAIESQFRVATQGKKRQFMRVEISDSGKGLTDEEMAQLFTPFFTTKAEGNGLGLVLSQRTVALHGGKLWAERGGVEPSVPLSQSGTIDKVNPRGMTFCVILPLGLD